MWTEQGIAGNGQARQQQLGDSALAKFCRAGDFGALAWADDRDVVALAHEALHEMAERHSDAVDFGRVGFGYEDKVQSGWPGWRQPASRRARGNDAMVV
jgi:hypothetical protein